MAKAKKKKRGGFLGLLQQSLSGWKRFARYTMSGQWANDISRAVHRGGAAERAKQRALQKEESRWEREEALAEKEWQEEQDRKYKEWKRNLDKSQAKHNHGLKRLQSGKSYETPKAATKKGASAAVRQAIAKVPTETTVIAHNRIGTKNGVQSHKKKVSKRDHQASVAAEILKTKDAGFRADSRWAVQCRTNPPQTITRPLDKRTAQGLAIDMNKEMHKADGDVYGIKRIDQ